MDPAMSWEMAILKTPWFTEIMISIITPFPSPCFDFSSPNFSACFSSRNLLYLASTSKALFDYLSPIISARFYFKQPTHFDFTYYKPTRLSQVYKITQEMQNNNKLTHIEDDSEQQQQTSFIQSNNLLPNSLLSFSSGYCLSQPLTSLPPSLTQLTYRKYHNSKIFDFPLSLTSLTLQSSITIPIKFPDNLKSLCFDYSANLRAPITFPPKLQILKLYGIDNSYIHKLNFPSTLTHLEVSPYFHDFTTLPNSLLHLECCDKFYRVNKIPTSLTSLYITRSSAETISGNFQIYKNLKRLKIWCLCDSLILPPSLTHLEINIRETSEILCNLSSISLPNLIHISSFRLTAPLLALSSLSSIYTHLHVAPYAKFSDSISSITIGNNSISQYPPSLTYLSKIFRDREELSLLPSSLVHLVCTVLFQEPIISPLPPNINILVLSHFNRPLNNLLPPSLTHLELRNNFNQPLIGLPKNLTHLILGDDFDHDLDHLPERLRYIKLGTTKERFTKPQNLPKGINTYLIYGVPEPSDELIESLSNYPYLSTFVCRLCNESDGIFY